MIADRPANIMPLYRDPYRSRWHWMRVMFLYIGLVLLGCFYGLAVAILPPNLVLVPFAPVLILALIILWMLPDLASYPSNTISKSFQWFLVANGVWPLYLAVVLPGLPWITPARLVLTVLVVSFTYGLATSKEFRAAIMVPLNEHPVFKWAMFIWIGIQLLTIALAPNVSDAFTRFGNHQVYETFIFFVSIWYFQRRGAAQRAVDLILVATAIVAMLGIWEAAQSKVPWANHVPSFLSVDPAYMAIVLGAQMRSGDGLYRAHSVFTVSLVFAEYLAMAMPLVIDRIINAKSRAWERPIFMALWLACFTGIYASNSRLGMVGFFLSHLVYFFIWGIRRWRSEKHDLLGPAAVLGYPAALMAFYAVVLSSRTLYVRLIGGGQHAASDDARKIQWERTWPLVGKNPIGHGPDQAADLIRYSNGTGQQSLDSYPINLLVDFGVIGFGSFLVILFYPVVLGWTLYANSRDREFELAGVAGCVLVVFAVGKMALSIGSNHYLAFVYMAMVLALASRAKREEPVVVH